MNRWSTCESEKYSKNVGVKVNVFWQFSHFYSTRVDHMFTARVIKHWGLGGSYLDPSHPKRFDHTINTRFGGSRKPYFFPTGRWWNNHLQMSIFKVTIFNVWLKNVTFLESATCYCADILKKVAFLRYGNIFSKSTILCKCIFWRDGKSLFLSRNQSRRLLNIWKSAISIGTLGVCVWHYA